MILHKCLILQRIHVFLYVLYAIDTSGNKVLEMYHVGDINGMVIESVVFNRISIVIVAKNVIGDSIIQIQMNSKFLE